jgi:hypothetical protein
VVDVEVVESTNGGLAVQVHAIVTFVVKSTVDNFIIGHATVLFAGGFLNPPANKINYFDLDLPLML